MTESLIVRNSITINAPIAKVWDALINPEDAIKESGWGPLLLEIKKIVEAD